MLEEADKTLCSDGYKSYSYVRMAISEAINKLLQHQNSAFVTAVPIGVCPSCNGEGKLHISDCCGVPPMSNGDCDTSDFGICSACKDHCEYGVDCDECAQAIINIKL